MKAHPDKCTKCGENLQYYFDSPNYQIYKCHNCNRFTECGPGYQRIGCIRNQQMLENRMIFLLGRDGVGSNLVICRS